MQIINLEWEGKDLILTYEDGTSERIEGGLITKHKIEGNKNFIEIVKEKEDE